MQPGIFAQLVVVPLFSDHQILSQVAGHNVNVVKGLPPLTISPKRTWSGSPGTGLRRGPRPEDAVGDDAVRAQGCPRRPGPRRQGKRTLVKRGSRAR